MVRLLGIPLGDADARWLIGALYRDAHAHAVSAALRIDRGIDHDLYAVALSPDERSAILGVLDDPPDGELAHEHAAELGQSLGRVVERGVRRLGHPTGAFVTRPPRTRR